MTDAGAKQHLRRDLQTGRDALLWKLDGLSDYDVRRPMTPTGTDLLGLVEHLALVEMGYFGFVETHWHVGHADIVRELIDGAAGLRAGNGSLPPGDRAWWENHRARVERAPRQAAQR